MYISLCQVRVRPWSLLTALGPFSGGGAHLEIAEAVIVEMVFIERHLGRKKNLLAPLEQLHIQACASVIDPDAMVLRHRDLDGTISASAGGVPRAHVLALWSALLQSNQAAHDRRKIAVAWPRIA